MAYTQQTECKEWQFKKIPEFIGGKMHPVFADVGQGMEISDNKTAASFMHSFSEVSAESADEYIELLEKSGFEKKYDNGICGNRFCQFKVSEGLLYISFMKNSAVMRIILDRCRAVDAGSFGYSEFSEVFDNTEAAQYSLHYDAMIRGTTCDCGMNYIFRLHDNSLIIIDGGEMEQATDVAVEDYIKFLHELTCTKADEKLKISLWLCTHAHNDHCDFFSKLLLFHADEFEVERTAFNFPNPENTKHSASIEKLRTRLAEKFPNADYIKLHAGTRFNIANAEIEVLVSNEDTVGLDEEDPFPGTNSTSVIFTVTADGVKTFFLADCGDDNGSVLVENYPSEITDCTFLQAAHHGINRVYDVYEQVNAKFVFLPQCIMNMETRFSEVYEHLRERYKEENILFAQNATDIFTLKDGSYTQRKRAHVGTAYDGSEW